MNKLKVLFVFMLLTPGLIISPGCLKLDDENKAEDEIQLLNNYIEKENITVEPTVTGLYFIEQTAGTGKRANRCDTVSINYTGRLLDGYIFDESEEGKPFTFILGARTVISGLAEGMLKMKEGGSARLIIPSGLAYGTTDYGDIPGYSTLVMDIELVEVKTGAILFSIDGLQSNTTESGLTYYIVEEGESDARKSYNGALATVKYTGFLNDGTIFDSSKLYDGEFHLTVSESRIIAGWYEALMLMKEGDKFHLVVPPALGYGKDGVPPIIPENATLYFDIELISVD